MGQSRENLIRWSARWVVALIALLAGAGRSVAAPSTTEPAALARVDALLDDASRKLAAAVNPEEDCRTAATLVNTLLQQHAIDEAMARQYASQIAYLRATAGETIVAAAYKQAEADLAAFQSKLAEDKSRLLDPKIETAEARHLADELAGAARQVGADLRALPNDDRRTTDLAERMSALQEQVQVIAAKHSAHQTVAALRQQWQQMSAQSAGWQDETLPPWAQVEGLPDPLVSLERTRALVVSSGAMLSSATVDRARTQGGNDADLDALLAEVRSDQQAAIVKASGAIAELLDQAERGVADHHTPGRGEAAAMKAISQSLRTSLAVLPDAQVLTDRADDYANRCRAGSTAMAAAAPIPAPTPSAPAISTQAAPKPAKTITAPRRLAKTPARAPTTVAVAPADLSMPMGFPTHRDGLWARLAWTLTGVLAALLAFCKSQPEEIATVESASVNGGAVGSAGHNAFARVQLDPVGLILMVLGAWWLLSSPDAALVPAIAMILCGLLGAIDLIGKQLSLSHGLVEMAHCIAGPASVAAMFIFIVHLFIGGAGFI